MKFNSDELVPVISKSIFYTHVLPLPILLDGKDIFSENSSYSLLYPLHKAAASGNLLKLTELLQNPNSSKEINSPEPKTKWTPLHFAVVSPALASGNLLEVVKLLVGNGGADVSVGDWLGRTCIHLLIQRPDGKPKDWLETFKYLIGKSTKLNLKDLFGRQSSMRGATPQEYQEFLQFLLEAGYKDVVRLPDTESTWTHLHAAFQEFDVLEETLELLLELGFDFESTSVLNYAIQWGRSLSCIQNLIRIGKLDWNRKGYLGCGVLHSAIISWNVEILKYFVSLGVDVNSVNDYGQTPLHLLFYMTKFRNERRFYSFVSPQYVHKVADVILTNGKGKLDLEKKDWKGKTVWELAREKVAVGDVEKRTLQLMESYLNK